MAFELDLAGGAVVLKELAAPHIEALAGVIAAAAGEGATVTMSTTDRARATIRVPAEAQAKDGVLTKAAAAVGLEVVAKPPRKRAPRRSAAKKGAAK